MKTVEAGIQIATPRTLLGALAILAFLGCAADVRAQEAAGSGSAATAADQSNMPAAAQSGQAAIERTARRFRVGVEAGVGLDPELMLFGAHGSFGPLFRHGIDFRPGVDFGVGEVTTMFGINLDVLYSLPGTGAGWAPYIGAGPNFTLSHRGFETEETDKVDGEVGPIVTRNRFDFSDTDFEGGMNFIVGARRANGLFLEMKATAYGVSNVRLLVGFNF